jgi:hypothetical protein|nr:MAG TPA: Protein of unknown function (DUF722) [Caudoviricetes sp.]
MQRINRASWRIIETILLRYPQRKKEYEEYISDIMASSAGGSSRPSDPAKERDKAQSVTEAKALKMTSVYHERIKKEIEAVEFVYNSLRPEEQKVIRIRYWSKGLRAPIPYLKIGGASYSERQMKRIVFKTIEQIGRYIGELK